MKLFFFSSRRRHTRWTGDWSSDVCSSDLAGVGAAGGAPGAPRPAGGGAGRRPLRPVPGLQRGRPPRRRRLPERLGEAAVGAGDHQALNLTGALKEAVDLGVAVPLLDGEVADVAVAAEDL